MESHVDGEGVMPFDLKLMIVPALALGIVSGCLLVWDVITDGDHWGVGVSLLALAALWAASVLFVIVVRS